MLFLLFVVVFLLFIVCVMGRCTYICIDLYMCMNTDIHAGPYVSAYDAVVCTL